MADIALIDDTPSLHELLDLFTDAKSSVNSTILGQEAAIDQVLTGLICGGHVLIESPPGLGKTLLVRTIATVCGLKMSRIQFTPDLMPADITGSITLVRDETNALQTRFQAGPIFANLVLADEINRATPKTQSALLEGMQEQTVTIAGTQHLLPTPFFVLATQNPIEMDGTYVLPEAQIDRFALKVKLPFPDVDVLDRIIDITTGTARFEPIQIIGVQEILQLQELTRQVILPSALRKAVARFVRSTQPNSERASKDLARFVKVGVSPRGAQAFVLASKAHALMQGRFNVSSEDLRAVVLPSLSHRLHLTYASISEDIGVDTLLMQLLEKHLVNEA